MKLKGILLGFGTPIKPVFRVYSEDRKTFKDYEIYHPDLEVEIDDTTAIVDEDNLCIDIDILGCKK